MASRPFEVVLTEDLICSQGDFWDDIDRQMDSVLELIVYILRLALNEVI